MFYLFYSIFTFCIYKVLLSFNLISYDVVRLIEILLYNNIISSIVVIILVLINVISFAYNNFPDNIDNGYKFYIKCMKRIKRNKLNIFISVYVINCFTFFYVV